MTTVRLPLELRIARLVVGAQAAAALTWTVESSLYRGGFYDDAIGLAIIVSALLVLPGILPGALRHGR